MVHISSLEEKNTSGRMAGYQKLEVIDQLSKEPWYWGPINKETAQQLLEERQHGSFLVRNSRSSVSSREGACVVYTLVVKKDDTVRNIRIHQGQNGLYGFLADMCHFQDVSELISYMRDNPQVLHNSFPFIDLLHPVAKPRRPRIQRRSESASVLLHRLVDVNKELMLMQHEHTQCVRRRKELVKLIEQGKTTLSSLGVVLSLYEEQLTLQAVVSGQASALMRPAGEAPLHNDADQIGLTMNRALMNERVAGLRTRVQWEEEQHNKQSSELERVRHNIDLLKPQIHSKQKEKSLLRLNVEEKGMDKDYLDLLLKEEKQIDQSHQDPRNWWVDCNRDEAVTYYLKDRIPGTFLVRPTQSGNQAISIVCYDDDGAIKIRHCLICHNPDINQYGFHEEYCIFASVEELVKKHQTLSLKFYNSQLDVCLTYPVNYNPPTMIPEDVGDDAGDPPTLRMHLEAPPVPQRIRKSSSATTSEVTTKRSS